MQIDKEFLKANILSCKKTYFMSDNGLSLYKVTLSQWEDFYNEKVAIVYIKTNNIRKAKKELLQVNDIFNIEKREFVY